MSNRTTYRSVRIEQNQLVAQNALGFGGLFQKSHMSGLNIYMQCLYVLIAKRESPQ